MQAFQFNILIFFTMKSSSYIGIVIATKISKYLNNKKRDTLVLI